MTVATQDQAQQTESKPSQPADPIIFTESAASKVAELIAEEDNDNLMLRVFITGGGCSGFQYGFTFDEEVGDEDNVVKRTVNYDDPNDPGQQNQMTVTLLADPMSLIYLMNSEIDYKEDLSGARFVIRNPNAQTTCGCGSSFSV